MKAQSELTGDRERAAEMTAPRLCGVTIWMDRFKEMSKRLTITPTTSNKIAATFKAAKIAQFETPELPELPKITIDTEVNHCPTDQRWSACTP